MYVRRQAVQQLHSTAAAASPPSKPQRDDLDPAKYTSGSLGYQNTATTSVIVPAFTFNPTGNGPSQYNKAMQDAPNLDQDLIKKIKAEALKKLSADLQQKINQATHKSSAVRIDGRESRIRHPGGITSAAELVLMQDRLAKEIQPQHWARHALVTGDGVRRKTDYGKWAPPTDCKPDTYGGPYAMADVYITYDGKDGKRDGKTAPPKPSEAFQKQHLEVAEAAPQDKAGHISFVELDAQMAYKMAVAWWATGDDRGIAAMARALELLRDKAPQGAIERFLQWVDGTVGPMAQMKCFVETKTKAEIQRGVAHVYNNWHSSIIEAMMAVGILSDREGLYNQGREIFKDTGLGGLLQAAELAWQQDDDLYSCCDYALVGAMELHARIIRARLAHTRDGDRVLALAMLPQGFIFGSEQWYKDHVPNWEPVPEGTKWKFETKVQQWVLLENLTSKYLKTYDGPEKVLNGISFLPCGWEVGYNHYAGRLGLKMPETAALLQANWPEHE
eukprot:gene1819-2153_t